MDHLPNPALVLSAAMLVLTLIWLTPQFNRWWVLQKNKKVFQQRFEVADEGMALISLKWRCMKVNKALCKLLGFEASELLSMDFQRLIHPDDFNKSLPQLKQILEGQLPMHQATQRYLDNKGDLKTFTVNVSAARDKWGNPHHFVSQFKNVHSEGI
ncbi:MAG: PAS domain S-box protein [Pseudomonadota bacterium]